MKTLKTIFILLALVCANNSFAQEKQLPDKQETIKYIETILKETVGFNLEKEDLSWKMGRISFSPWYSNREWVENDKSSDIKGYQYDVRTDYSRVVNIIDDNSIYSYSPIKGLKIIFETNVCTYDRYIYEKHWKTGKWDWFWTKKKEPTNDDTLYYKNEPGTRERLLKALEHLVMLSKKEKEEEKKKDPFGN